MTWVRDDERRLIVVTMSGAISLADVLTAIEQQQAEHAWAYAVLYDLRAARADLTAADTRRLALRVEQLRAAERGPVAVVTSDDALYGMSRMYAMLTERAGLQISVFRDRAKAERWLGLE